MTWQWDSSHFPRRVTAALADIWCGPAERGVDRGLVRYGVALAGWRVRAVDGYILVSPMGHLRSADVVHRELAARRARDRRLWLLDAGRWGSRIRPGIRARLKSLERRDLSSLDEQALARHIEQVHATAVRGVKLHFELHLADMLPLGRLLVAAWDRGHGTTDVLERTRGLSPGSRPSAAVPASTAVGRLDVDAPTLMELSDLAASQPPSTIVPAERWGDPELDDLLDDVERTFWIRDDNATVLLAAPIGLLRVALLEAGERLDVRAMEATAAEAASLLRGNGGPAAGELERRAQQRSETRPIPVLAAPEIVHDIGQPGPTSQAFARALLAYDSLFESERPHGIGSAAVTGRAVVADTPDAAFDRLRPGDILVVRTTSPAFDPVLAVTGGLVCEMGGPLSHAAIAAREMGITAVLGLEAATTTIPDGATVTINPTHPASVHIVDLCSPPSQGTSLSSGLGETAQPQADQSARRTQGT